MTEIPIVIGTLRTFPQNLVKWLEDLEITEQVDHPDYSIKIGQNIKKSSGDFLSLKLQWETTS